MTLVSQLAPIFMQLVSAVLPMVVTIFGAILGAIGPLITILAGLLIPIIQALMPVVVVVFGVIANVITAVMQIIMGIIQVVTGIISGNWSMVWEGIGNIFSGIWNTIVAVVGGALNIVWSTITNSLGLVFGFIGSILGNIGQFFADTWNNITRGISDFVGGIGKFFESIPGTIQGALSAAGTWLYDAGKNIVQGLFDGIKSLASTIGNFFLGLLPGWIVEPFKIALGIQSPSKLFRQFGRHIGEGLMLGTGDTKDDIGASMRDLVKVPDMPAFGAGTASIRRTGHGGVVTNNYTINQVDDPIGTAHAIARRQTALAV
jgi:phage-related protein